MSHKKKKSCHSANSFTIRRASQTEEGRGRVTPTHEKKQGAAAEEVGGGNSIRGVNERKGWVVGWLVVAGGNMGERDPIEAGEGARNEARAHSWLNLSRFEGRLIEFAKRRNDIY